MNALAGGPRVPSLTSWLSSNGTPARLERLYYLPSILTTALHSVLDQCNIISINDDTIELLRFCSLVSTPPIVLRSPISVRRRSNAPRAVCPSMCMEYSRNCFCAANQAWDCVRDIIHHFYRPPVFSARSFRIPLHRIATIIQRSNAEVVFNAVMALARSTLYTGIATQMGVYFVDKATGRRRPSG